MSDERLGTTDTGYKFDEVIGSGGFGTVYRVSNRDGETFALKVLLADVARTPQGLARFKREVETVRSLSHTSSVDIFDAGSLSDGSAYFTMELLLGEDLLSRIGREGKMSPTQVSAIIEPVCGVLAALHAEGQLHRDIKAPNIFLCDNGRVVLLDFGIAKFFDRQGMTLTNSRELVGTPCAMTPEQLLGAALGPHTDVYALGALTFHMLTGSLAFASSSAMEMQQLHQHAARQRPSSFAQVSAALDMLVMRAMAIDPRKRPRDAGVFLEEFQRALSGEGTSKERSVEGYAVFATLGFFGDDEVRAAQAMSALDSAMSALRALGFELASMQCRGFVCARLQQSGEDEVALERQLLRIQAQFESAAPADSRIFRKRGSMTVLGGSFMDGEALIPTAVSEVLQ